MPSISRRLAPWLVFVAATTALLTTLRTTLDKSHVALIYLLIVLIGASRTGRRGGVILAILCFFCFNFFLLPPYQAFTVRDSRDWFVLLAFLVTSLVAAQLLYRAQNQAAIAQQRSEEINRLSMLGAETLNVGQAADAVDAVVRVIQSTLELGSCEVYLPCATDGSFRLAARATDPDYRPIADAMTDVLFDYVMTHDVAAVQRTEGSVHVLQGEPASFETAFTQRDARSVVFPLRVRYQTVGVLRLSDPNRVHFDPTQLRFAESLTYYAALAVERVRLTAEAEQAVALQAADRVKNAFIAAISHDLRTPLTAIRGLAQELGASGDERALIIETEANRLNRLVADLLELSRLNAGAIELQPELNAIEDLIGAMLNQLSTLPRSNDVVVHVPRGELIIGRFDFLYSLRALVNLVENALKYSPAGSPVDIRTDIHDNQVRIAVCDRGSGIPPGDVDRVFEPYVRLATGGSDGGAGLGLAIAQRIAAAQGGSVQYAAREGGGSIFTLCLPGANIGANSPSPAVLLTLP